MLPRQLIAGLTAGLILALVATSALAQDIRTVQLQHVEGADLEIIEDSITGGEIVDYVIGVNQPGILSVDLQTSNTANYFNITPVGSQEAIFIGSTKGAVADMPVHSAGEYVIRVYLMRSAARRNETAHYSLAVSIGAPEFADSLSGGPDFWKVSGVGGGDALNVRDGPSTRYPVTSKLRNGEIGQNRGCRMSGDQRWCLIRVAHSGVTGWVAGRFLVETAAPRAPVVPEGGPVGNGTPFDATGTIPCANAPDEPTHPCPFGVVREGPGNAGVWISLGDGNEQHILFEGGEPVTTNSADALSFEKKGYVFDVRIGNERYEIPEAVIFGG